MVPPNEMRQINCFNYLSILCLNQGVYFRKAFGKKKKIDGENKAQLLEPQIFICVSCPAFKWFDSDICVDFPLGQIM